MNLSRKKFLFVPKTAWLAALFGLLTLLPGLVRPEVALAHPGGWSPFFQINGQFASQYFVLSNKYGDGAGDNVLDVPQSELTRTFLPNESIDFNVDLRYLTIPPSLGKVNFTIDTGDGNKYASTHITHSFTHPGSYIVKVEVDSLIQGVKGTIEAVLINVVPYDGYLLPQAAIIAEGKSLKSDDSIYYSSNQPVHFDAHESATGSTRITSYTWDFGDSKKSDEFATTHTYDPSFQFSLAILRVKDENGLFSDAYIFPENQHPTPKTASTNATPSQTTHAQLSLGKRFNKLYLDTSVWLRNTLARFGGIGKPVPKYFIALLLLIAAVLGALHALTPGHSKSLMAALLIGKKQAKTKDVIVLSSAITITHTSIIYILGIIFLVLDSKLSLTKVLPFFERLSAVVVIALGVFLISKGVRAILVNHRHTHDHKEGVDHHHDHVHDYSAKSDSTWGLFLAGASGGLVPCVDALSLLIVAASVHATLLGLLIVFSFSLGLAASIVLIGLLVIHTKKALKLEERIGKRVAIIAPLVTGTFIALLGLALLFGHQI